MLDMVEHEQYFIGQAISYISHCLTNAMISAVCQARLYATAQSVLCAKLS